MNYSPVRLAWVCALSLYPLACSASDPGTSGGGTSHGGTGGASSQAGSSAAGSSANPGGAGGMPSSSGAGGTGQAGAGGMAGALGSAGAAGSSNSGAAGGGGAPVTCTPGTGTEPVGDLSELDQKTCLTWTKLRSSTTLTNKQAYKYCNDLTQDGITDWRVPSPEELVTWPGLLTADTAYITGPIYIPTGSTVMDGCTGNSHSCNIAEYSDHNLSCAWQGVGFIGWVACVSGTATAGTTNAAFAAASCNPCNSELGSFEVTDCSAYAN